MITYCTIIKHKFIKDRFILFNLNLVSFMWTNTLPSSFDVVSERYIVFIMLPRHMNSFQCVILYIYLCKLYMTNWIQRCVVPKTHITCPVFQLAWISLHSIWWYIMMVEKSAQQLILHNTTMSSSLFFIKPAYLRVLGNCRFSFFDNFIVYSIHQFINDWQKQWNVIIVVLLNKLTLQLRYMQTNSRRIIYCLSCSYN